MFRVLVVIVLVLFPLISKAEEPAKKDEQVVVVVVSVDKQLGEVKVTIVKRPEGEKAVFEQKHRRRAK